MKRKRKVRTQRRGAVLMTVTVVTCMMVIIVAAGISLVGHTNARSNKEYRMKQAYFVASSCLESFVSETTGLSVDATHQESEIAAAIESMKSKARTGETVTVEIKDVSGSAVAATQPRWNDVTCTLKIEPVNAGDTTLNDLKAIATATYLDQTKSVVAYLSVQELFAGKSNTRALEVIGTNGGGNDSYNNMRVYGNAGAIADQSHDKNTMYDCSTNDCKFYGDVLVRGSLTSGVQMRLGRNPYYVNGFNDVDGGGNETPGCTMTVTRTLNIANNETKLTSVLAKNKDSDFKPIGNNAYNYVQTGEALLMQSGGGSYIGDNDQFQVDVYTGLLYMGQVRNNADVLAKVMSGVEEAYANGEITQSQRDRYYNKIVNGAQGNSQHIYGNVYAIKRNANFPGDVVVDGINNVIHGDLWVEGDLYVNGSLEVTGTIHFKKTAAENPMHGSVNCPNIPLYEQNRSSSDRATEPPINVSDPDPYRYFPEHMLLLDGFSTIKSTYTGMYEADGVTHNLSIPTINDPQFRNGRNPGDPVTMGDGTVFTPDGDEVVYLINKSARIDKIGSDTENRVYVVDLDSSYSDSPTGKNPDGNNDIVLLMQNSTPTPWGFNQSVADRKSTIVVHNTDIDADNNPNRICYFVTDSGANGVCNNETAGDPTAVSTYDHGSFKLPLESDTLPKARQMFENYMSGMGYSATQIADAATYTDPYNPANTHHMVDGPVFYCGNGKLRIFDYGTYMAFKLNQTINPTEDSSVPASYQTTNGCSVFLATEGSYLYIGQESMIQASVYCPRATFLWNNNGVNLKIMPDPTVSGNSQSMNIPVNVFGCCIAGNFQPSANNVHVVYQKVSEHSMIQKAKGPGRQLATESFKLVKYAAS
ncbi:MAG: hypothetical protein J6I46_15000 [Ruminococcus sp.]|nr:hypothetical protein [Ruminococcus sp.]